MMPRLPFALLTAALVPALAHADPAPFDLVGPSLRVSVTHGATTLPVAQVPNLAGGDRIAIAADLPAGRKADRNARYLLVAGFLRGATNPPPKSWFFSAETWKTKKNALALTVPDGARQLVVFVVPETGGAVDAVVDAVRKQPGAFVRAAQELNQASLDRARLDAFLDSIRELERTRPERIEAVSPLLSRSLAIKLKAECLDQAADVQASCLTQSRDSLVLADGHSASLTETLIGAPTDLALQLAATPEGGYGYYSPYIGVVRDLAKIFGAFQSTQFRYIPALARPRDDRLALLLNAAPSFASPKSVMVVAMPAIEPPQIPPMRRAEADRLVCAARPDLVLPVEGAPLIYATGYAHDMSVRVTTPQGGAIDLPVRADAERGGYVLDQVGMRTAGLGNVTDAMLHGIWGFTPFDGPRFRLQIPRSGGWRAVDTDPATLVVGRDNGLALAGPTASCVESVTLQAGGVDQPLAWTANGAERIALTLPLGKATPGAMSLLVKQFGVEAPERIALTALAEAGRFDGFTLHAGDAGGTLAGTRLDLVASMTVDGITFKSGDVVRADKADRLPLTTETPPSFAVGQAKTATLALSDGRTRTVKFTVAAARPKATVIARSVTAGPSSGLAVAIGGDAAISQDSRLTFSLRAEGMRFSASDSVEIATLDGLTTTVASGRGLTVQDARIAVASVEPGKVLGVSAHGPLRWRLVQDSVAGDWTPLTTLVRVPRVAGVACAEVCTLTGTDLFLVESVAANAGFVDAARVPEGFTGGALKVPKPVGGTLFLRLRDDAGVTATMAVKS